MLSFLPTPVLQICAGLLLVLNTLFWGGLVFVVGMAKWLVPVRAWQAACTRVIVALSTNWVAVNNVTLWLTQRITWEVSGLAGLSPDRWYLIIANHRSVVDIPILQRIFYRKVPFLRFFLKQELRWVPVLGFAWWALDFPFMQRHSRAFLARHPERRGEDLAATRRASERFKHSPTSILNFLEGTRYTLQKHAEQQSPYRHLLRPKAGGIAFTIAAMGEMFDAVLDVTLYYPEFPDGNVSLGDLLGGRIRRVVVQISERQIPPALLHGDYENDAAYREQFQQWVGDLWQQKDAQLDAIVGLTA